MLFLLFLRESFFYPEVFFPCPFDAVLMQLPSSENENFALLLFLEFNNQLA